MKKMLTVLLALGMVLGLAGAAGAGLEDIKVRIYGFNSSAPLYDSTGKARIVCFMPEGQGNGCSVEIYNYSGESIHLYSFVGNPIPSFLGHNTFIGSIITVFYNPSLPLHQFVTNSELSSQNFEDFVNSENTIMWISVYPYAGTPPAEEEAEPPTPALPNQAKVVGVSTSVTLREGPGTDYKALAQVPLDAYVNREGGWQLVGEHGWTQVSYKGVTGWICDLYLLYMIEGYYVGE